jgi:hypothetical protein
MRHITGLKHIILLFMLISPAVLATTKAYIEGNDFTLDDLLKLYITTDKKDATAPDLNPLKQDFRIMSESKQIHQTILNGKAYHTAQWIIGLMPKKTGMIEIPSLTIHHEKTPPFSIEIIAPKINPEGRSDIFFTTQINQQLAYPNTPLELSIHIHVAEDLYTQNLELDPPDDPTIKLFRLENSSKQAFVNQKRYKIFTLKYLLFVSEPGHRILPPFTLFGQKALRKKKAEGDLFSFYTLQLQPFTKIAPPISVSIQPPPTLSANTTWLPADHLTLSEDPSLLGTPAKRTLGEAITQTIHIQAINTPVYLLPEPATLIPSHNNDKHYQNKAQYHTQVQDGQLMSTVTQTITYIPATHGTWIRPALAITWWNNASKQLEISTLPSQSFEIAQATPLTANTPTHAPPAVSQPAHTQRSHTMIAVLALILTFSLLGTVWVLRKKHILRQSLHHPTFPSSNSSDLLAALKTQCKQHNLLTLYKTLLQLEKSLPLPSDWRNRAPPEVVQIIQALEQTLYRDATPLSPDYARELSIRFLKIIIPYLQRLSTSKKSSQNTQNTQNELPALYPENT